MTRASRERRVGGALILLVALGLGAGCGGGSEPSGRDQKPGTSAPAPTPTTGPTTSVSKPAKHVDNASPGPNGEQTDVLSNLPGSTKPGCVKVGPKARDVRSGDMAAGPFDTARKAYVPSKASKRKVSLYFIPKHTENLKQIAVTGTNKAGGAKLAAESKNVADAEQFKFFQLTLDVPKPGTWTIAANTGQDNGCWIVTLN